MKSTLLHELGHALGLPHIEVCDGNHEMMGVTASATLGGFPFGQKVPGSDKSEIDSERSDRGDGSWKRVVTFGLHTTAALRHMYRPCVYGDSIVPVVLGEKREESRSRGYVRNYTCSWVKREKMAGGAGGGGAGGGCRLRGR